MFIGPLSEWTVTMREGVELRCMAHSYGVEGDDYVFSVFTDGSPPVQVPVLYLPVAAVDTVYG